MIILEIGKAIMGVFLVFLMFGGYIFLLFYGIPWVYKWWHLLGAVLFGRKEMLDKLHEGDLCKGKETRSLADRFEEFMGQPPDNRYNHQYGGWRASGPIPPWKPLKRDTKPQGPKEDYDFPAEWNDLL